MEEAWAGGSYHEGHELASNLQKLLPQFIPLASLITGSNLRRSPNPTGLPCKASEPTRNDLTASAARTPMRQPRGYPSGDAPTKL